MKNSAAVHEIAHVERPAGRIVEHVAHEDFVAGAEGEDDDAPRESVADHPAQLVDAVDELADHACRPVYKKMGRHHRCRPDIVRLSIICRLRRTARQLGLEHVLVAHLEGGVVAGTSSRRRAWPRRAATRPPGLKNGSASDSLLVSMSQALSCASNTDFGVRRTLTLSLSISFCRSFGVIRHRGPVVGLRSGLDAVLPGSPAGPSASSPTSSC